MAYSYICEKKHIKMCEIPTGVDRRLRKKQENDILTFFMVLSQCIGSWVYCSVEVIS